MSALIHTEITQELVYSQLGYLNLHTTHVPKVHTRPMKFFDHR